MLLISTPAAPECRVAKIPACEDDACAAQGDEVLALSTFQMRIRDSIDFRVDASEWVAANGRPELTDMDFDVASDSPQEPQIVGSSFTANGMGVVVLQAANDAEAGHAYYIDVTLDFAATTGSATELAIPARKLVRRIHVVVVAG